MLVPHKKNQYALRAIYELACCYGEGPTKTATIATRQAIPIRFLEVILNQLKQSGIIQSKRGFQGGYFLLHHPQDISIGDVMRFMQRKSATMSCLACVSKEGCPFDQNCAFASLWQQVQNAVNQIYDNTSLQDLIDNHQRNQR
jgi:Rrf2 family cysteine metabolism transcriptional repressor